MLFIHCLPVYNYHSFCIYLLTNCCFDFSSRLAFSLSFRYVCFYVKMNVRLLVFVVVFVFVLYVRDASQQFILNFCADFNFTWLTQCSRFLAKYF